NEPISVSVKPAAGQVPGLWIVVSASGRKIWHYRRRVSKSKAVVSLKLGNFPAYSIPAAREWASDLNLAVERGEDPRAAMRREKLRQSMTVDKAHEIYMDVVERGERKQLRARTISDKAVIFSRDISPRLGSKGLSDLTEDDCWNAVYDKAATSKDRVNKMAGELSCFLRWCAGREGRMSGIELAEHPAPSLNSNWFSTGPKANTRFLTDEEICWLFQALGQESAIYRRGLLLLLLTAARRSELFGAPGAEFIDGVWTLPVERSKNGEVNVVALGPWGRSLLGDVGAWLLPSPRIDGPQLCGWFGARDRLHRRMEVLAQTSLPSWHFHDLRRTFRSNARGLGIDEDIAELMLNHKRKGIGAVYDKNQELSLRAQGFAVWEAHLVRIACRANVAGPLGIRTQALLPALDWVRLVSVRTARASILYLEMRAYSLRRKFTRVSGCGRSAVRSREMSGPAVRKAHCCNIACRVRIWWRSTSVQRDVK
ncbi:tyrosine-type recombinase/integrase, partial [Rhizorhabdus wittichii]|uniref:tyrosine-type recombinase/integrase n=1 Tax=Rhizorhabdus wittichii TaxID=160791 RepID=UPI0009D9F179